MGGFALFNYFLLFICVFGRVPPCQEYVSKRKKSIWDSYCLFKLLFIYLFNFWYLAVSVQGGVKRGL